MKTEAKNPSPAGRPRADKHIALVFDPRHALHHVHDRGYGEVPRRVEIIHEALKKTPLFKEVSPRPFPESHITAVHDRKMLAYFKKVCAAVPEDTSVYPYIFPLHHPDRPPADPTYQAGYFCIDTFTPLNRKALDAAVRAVDCTLTAADLLGKGTFRAYALVRPPGHHSEKKVFGGFCYFNSASIAAHYLSRLGSVAILDIDYHHGNGHQDIFYERDDVLTVSLHGRPSIAYPFFSGFTEERGAGKGEGFNINYPLPEKITAEVYLKTLHSALKKIETFNPAYLLVALGFDTAKGDPTGSWPLEAGDFQRIGELIGAQKRPILLVQEGGYRLQTLGRNAASFFTGFHGASFNLP
ncbi:MAG: histone deacetylase family protein [Spirochaetales bacterium]|nr:histone deacetylase family protein [Spirochaetales bacterium]